MVGWNAERWRAATLPNNSSGAACPGAFAPPPRAFATKSAVCAACFSAFSFKYWSGKRAAEGVEGCGRYLILDFKSDTRNLSQLRNHPFRHKGKPLEHLRNLAMLINKRHSTPTLACYESVEHHNVRVLLGRHRPRIKGLGSSHLRGRAPASHGHLVEAREPLLSFCLQCEELCLGAPLLASCVFQQAARSSSSVRGATTRGRSSS